MYIGDTDYNLAVFIVLIFLVLSIIANIFLFLRGHHSYSVKYELYLNSPYFREHPWLCQAVEVLYHVFFVVPFALLFVIAVMRAITVPMQFFTIMVNGLIVLLTIYPIKNKYFYTNKLAIWVLVVASQLNTLYLHYDTSKSLYPLLCSIFYPVNCIIFCLALITREEDYFQLNQAISLCQEELRAIYPEFTKEVAEQEKDKDKDKQKEENREIVYQQNDKKKGKEYNIPSIFNGGLYGLLSRSKKNRNLKRILLYLSSLIILGLNAYLVWRGSSSSLGVIGLITNFVYDIFILAFTALKSKVRSVRNTFLLVFIGRLLSFVFGTDLWIFGYCVLYLIVGVFIGKIIVNTRYPMKKQHRAKTQRHRRQHQNALKTPQFVLFILTAQIFLLVLAASFNVGNVTASDYTYSTSVSLPLWLFALIVVIATWIIILLMTSLRMIQRQRNNIHDNVEYYFGVTWLREMHVYVLVTYALIVGLGVYCYLVLLEPTVFYSCLFLPLILLALIKLDTEWVKNQYQVLVDIKEYNERVQKAKRIIEKKKIAIGNQRQRRIASQTFKFAIRPSANRFENSGAGLIAAELSQSETSTQLEQDQAIQDQLSKLTQEQLGLVEMKHNWRIYQDKIGPIQFFQDFLTPSDRWILLMILTITALSVSYALITYFLAGTIIGIFVILDLAVLMSYSPIFRYGKTHKEPQWPEYVLYYCGWAAGVIYWCFYRQYTAYALIWAGIYILVSGAAVAYGLFRNIKRGVVYMMLVNIGLTGVFVCLLLFMTVEVFQAALVTLVLCLLAIGAVPVAYNHLNGSIPTYIKIITGSLIFLGVVGTAITGFFLNVASDFAVFSFVAGSIYLVLFILASALYYERQQSKYQTPHVYSAYGKPVYKFDSRAQKLKNSVSHLVIYELAGIVVVVYAAAVTLVFQDKQYGVYAMGYYCVMSFLQDILFSIKTQNQLAQERQKLTKELLAKALKSLHAKYMVDFHTNHGSKQVQLEKQKLKDQAQQKQSPQQLNLAYGTLARKHYEWINVCEQQQKFLFFWIVLIEFAVFTQRKSEMVRLVTQTKQIQKSLMEYGIFIESLNYATDFMTKYQLVAEQIEGLHPEDYVRYQSILALHQQSVRHNQAQQRKKAQLEEELHQKREQEIFEQMQNQISVSDDQRVQEFQRMLDAIEPKKKYVDQDFAADQTTLGSLSAIVSKWRRPRRGEALVKGEINAYDVKQGQIGDCYLISSMGVLGQRWIKQALGMGNPAQCQIWHNQKGAYMVRFYKFLKKVYIIVDDQLPVDDQNQFVFAKSEDPQEIWPCIVEKAYAKLYGGYHCIVEGKCHRVFAQFTGGFPSELNIEEYRSNPNSLWQRIIDSNDNKYLMGAGSPSHADGDRAHSARGIVQGHAYSILNAREIQGHKLIQMKNPHGSGGVEWNGDFSDDSELMSKRLMQLLGHEKKDDGVFWMSIEDFIQEFKSLYVCAIFDEKWLKVPPVSGKFTEQNSFGLPKASDQTFRNPQFGIKVTKKCTFFVNMTQQAQNSVRGVNTIYLRIQKNEGKRITKHNTKTDLLCGKQLSPIDSITLSNEAVLQADSYPYTFTLYISCLEQGDQGDYVLEMYCNDREMRVVMDEEFDREQF